MEFNRLTVKGLKNLARTRGFRGYSGLNRNQLIDLLNRPILDDRNIDIGTPVLQPTIAPPPTRGQPVDDLKSLRRVKEVPKIILPEFNALKKR